MNFIINANDIGILFIFSCFLIGLFFITEYIRKRWLFSGYFTRKLIHVGVAIWSIGIFYSFPSKEIAVILPIIFVVSNIPFIRNRILIFCDIKKNDVSGFVYYPIALILLFWFCWDIPQRTAGIIGLLNLGFGDTFASVLGARFGRKKYRVGDVEKTYFGLGMMFIISFLCTLFVLIWGFGGFDFKQLIVAVCIACGVTIGEGLCGRGLDNLAVPLVSALIFSFFYL